MAKCVTFCSTKSSFSCFHCPIILTRRPAAPAKAYEEQAEQRLEHCEDDAMDVEEPFDLESTANQLAVKHTYM